MALFSWFNRKHNFATKRDDKATIEKELATFNRNTMWPVAQVRSETVQNQQTYVKALNVQKTERQKVEPAELNSQQDINPSLKNISPVIPTRA